MGRPDRGGFFAAYLLATPAFLISILLPIWNLPDAVLNGSSAEGPLDMTGLSNAMLSGSVLVYGFYRSQAAAGVGPFKGDT